MKSRSVQHLASVLLVLVVLGVGAIVFLHRASEETPQPELVETETPKKAYSVIGTSVEGRDIEAYTYGKGDTHLLFVGGVHGGYEWNSVLLAYQFIDYLEAGESTLPENLTISVIPSANPDGVYAITNTEGRFTTLDVPQEDTGNGVGRFNAHGVDLNRNFDCKWKPTSSWQGNSVSAGTEAFSEPETVAIRDFVYRYEPDAVVFWHSQANAVYASECEEGVLPQTTTVMNTYANAAGYRAVESFDQYEITGDAEGWLASIGIPAITVELETHETIEWERNLLGIQALLDLYKN